MDPSQRLDSPRFPRRRAAPWLLGFSFALIAVVTVVDILAPPEVHLGPFLVAAPALTASFAGAWTTALVGAVAVLAQVVVAVVRTSLTDLNHTYQILALILISVVVTFFAHLREQHESKVSRLRSIAQAAQGAVLHPLPRRSGPLGIASVYLAAEEETLMGGDLYAATRTASGTRLLIGDARGKGLDAISEASLVMGAFRVSAGRAGELPELVASLEAGVGTAQYAGGGAADGDTEAEFAREEAFVTALVLDIPDDELVVRVANCGHPPPLILREGRVVTLTSSAPSPPLGMTAVLDPDVVVESFPFCVGDVLLLYTDGVVEARDRTSRAFYPLTERLPAWAGDSPGELLRRLSEDLTGYVGGRLGDDAALVAVERRAPAAAPLAHGTS
ncbi:PP2C family protein-serine/threonine phosphatase [Streptomyces sp. NPDC048604]|uniref:PP2C family protein-serine/threonine phosphatase n=1 Tax=Streptomyces sp. NPDC048604 TaxID=3365578 RepID=UPI0037200C44